MCATRRRRQKKKGAICMKNTPEKNASILRFCGIVFAGFESWIKSHAISTLVGPQMAGAVVRKGYDSAGTITVRGRMILLHLPSIAAF